jgi:L-asparaginase
VPDSDDADPPARILLLSCGGTISSVPAGRGARPFQGAADLLGGLVERASMDIEALTFSTVPSADASLEDAVAIWRRTCAWADAPGRRAGTDTLEGVAFAVDALGVGSTPVVFTGAMRHPAAPGSDGDANLLAALQVAASPAAADLGVVVVLNDEIHLAARVRKSHTSNVATFVSPDSGPVGHVHEGRRRIDLRPARRHSVPPPSMAVDEVAVALLPAGIGEDGRLLGYLRGAGYRGVVVEGVGGGHLPSRVAGSAALHRLIVDAMPVVLTSRVGAGELLHRTYDFPGAETDLDRMGLISAGTLDGPKARVLLVLLLAAGCGLDEIRAFFACFGGYDEDSPAIDSGYRPQKNPGLSHPWWPRLPD